MTTAHPPPVKTQALLDSMPYEAVRGLVLSWTDADQFEANGASLLPSERRAIADSISLPWCSSWRPDLYRVVAQWLKEPTGKVRKAPARTAPPLDPRDLWLSRQRCAAYRISHPVGLRRLAEQGYACGVCRRLFELSAQIRFDHNHETGEFRGFLCSACNTGIGLLQDSPQVLEQALEYLEANGFYGTAAAEDDVLSPPVA